MNNRLLVGLVIAFVLDGSVGAQPPAGPGTAENAPSPEQIEILSSPTIEEFSAIPVSCVNALGDKKISLKWRVETGAVEIPITGVTIVKVKGPGPEVNFSSPDAKGVRELIIPRDTPSGRVTFAIIAVNAQGKTARDLADFGIFDPAWVGRQIALTDILMGRARVGRFFNLALDLHNPTSAELPSLSVKISAVAPGTPSAPAAEREISAKCPEFSLEHDQKTRLILRCRLPSGADWADLKITLFAGKEPVNSWSRKLTGRGKKLYSLSKE